MSYLLKEVAGRPPCLFCNGEVLCAAHRFQEYMDFELSLFDHLKALAAVEPRPQGKPVTLRINSFGATR